MSTKIFVNLPVKDLNRSIEFFTKLGYKFNAQFTDDTATCMIVTDDIYVMLLTHAKFQQFTPRPICDATRSTEVLVCFSCESRATVEDLVRKAVAAGGSIYADAKDHGFMYQHGFQDPDGHLWELFYMDPTFVQPPPENADREIVSSRLFDAPREVVFRAFTDPQVLARWWGPKGFTNTIDEFDLRPGGRWRFTMHGPDGTDYHNLSEFVEIVPNQRIVFRHGEPVHQFRMTMTFADEAGKTRLTWQMLFDELDEANKVRGFVAQANEQNFDRLAALPTMA